jgi:hypothetical protein
LLSKMDSPRLPAVCVRRILLPPDAGVEDTAPEGSPLPPVTDPETLAAGKGVGLEARIWTPNSL